MKKGNLVIYWVATALMSVGMLGSGDYGIKGIIGPIMQTIFIILSWYYRPADRKIVLVHQ